MSIEFGENLDKHKHAKLGEWSATAICGNDITSSCLYVTALSLMWAGLLAPLSLLLVAAVLWLFRGIYAEVVGALPLNGGAYNALLNTTSKYRASVAACLTILSYLATAVISGSEAVHYGASALHSLTGTSFSHWHLIIATVVLLFVFALLTIRGIGESAKVALGIFIFHLVTLGLLIVCGIWYVCTNGLELFSLNLAADPPVQSSHPLLFGFSVALLGISGFESSANFVEEQEEGVFPKTLRNMWIAVSSLNLSICMLALCIVPLEHIPNVQTTLLAHMGDIAAGRWLSLLISIDAAVVLSGAVLTSYVGVTGLVHRMTLDRCLPQFLLKLGRFDTHTRIILSFFVLSAVLIYVVEGDVATLAGVYTLSFLAVMCLFALGNILLKIKRDKLPRDTRASWLAVVLAICAVLIGIVGNVLLDLENVEFFLLYFVPTMTVVAIMLWRTTLLRVAIYLIRAIHSSIGDVNDRITTFLTDQLDQINSHKVVFFTRGDNIANLNNAMLYVRDNEHTRYVKIVTVVKDKSEVPSQLEIDLQFLDRAYPEIKIDFVIIEGTFSPKLLQDLSQEWRIPLNFMFIGSPGDHFPHQLQELGGARLII